MTEQQKIERMVELVGEFIKASDAMDELFRDEYTEQEQEQFEANYDAIKKRRAEIVKELRGLVGLP